jgi:hypothetical protein
MEFGFGFARAFWTEHWAVGAALLFTWLLIYGQEKKGQTLAIKIEELEVTVNELSNKRDELKP